MNVTDVCNTYFPYKNPRPQQIQAIKEIIECFESGKRFFALEAGTGVGKSAIAYTVAKYFSSKNEISEEYKNGALFVTTQKILQEQYIKDFGSKGLKTISSSKNYSCKRSSKILKKSCADTQQELRITNNNVPGFENCNFDCIYKIAKSEFIESDLSVTNFPYLLTEANFSGKIKPRRLLIIDEAHNIETELSKFVEISVSEQFSKTVLKLEMPKLDTQVQAFKWIKEIYWPKLDSHTTFVKSQLEKFDKLKENLEHFATLSKQLHLLEGHHQKIEKFLSIYEKDNWVYELKESDERKLMKLSFKPIDISQYSQQYLLKLGYYVLFMSATLLSSEKFLEGLGINKEQSGNLFLPSPFPKENKPIFQVSAGSMSANNIDKSLPDIVKVIKTILNEHKNEKGIIHTHSYKISNYIQKSIRSDRLLFAGSENRDEILKKHKNSKNHTVIISPSMTEGVDLEGDLSRFQIICKIPYPYLGDKLVSKRMHKWDWWYPFQTAKTIIQSIGRSIRSEKDSAVTYIIDSDWRYFYSKNKDLFPKDFDECLK